MASNFKLVGHTRLRDESGNAMENHVGVEVEDGVSRAVANSPTPRPGRVPIESKSKDVARFLSRWNHDIHETARYIETRNRPLSADPKPKDLEPIIDLPDHQLVSCPSCNGTGDYMCALCDGDACVTRRRALEWRQARN